MSRFYYTFFVCIFLAFNTSKANTFYGDSTIKIKTPKHYFMPTVFFEYYGSKLQTIDTFPKKNKDINSKLKDYKYSQITGGFILPVYTKDKRRSDSITSNFHVLATGGFVYAMPEFSGIKNHVFFKGSLGGRLIYNTGKKGIWFYDLTPFFSQDLTTKDQFAGRVASTILYDHMFSETFSLRVGITRTFILGNRYHLPYFGFRIGSLDKTYFSFQFPKKINFSFPIGNKFRGNIYSKTQGGLYNYSNRDSLYLGSDETILFGRSELLTGFKFDYSPSKRFGVFFSCGVSSKNRIGMASVHTNENNLFLLQKFYSQNLKSRGFINIGITVRFGNAKKIYNNKNLYEVIDLNNSNGTGDNNNEILNTDIPNQKGNLNKVKLKDVQDLIDEGDLY